MLGVVIERSTSASTATETTAATAPSPSTDRSPTSTVAPRIAAPATADEVITATTAALPSCHPRDDDCDGWWWSTPPAPGRPISLSVEVAPNQAAAGTEVIISIHAEDPDASIQAPFVCISTADGTAMQGYIGEQPLQNACLAPAVQCQRPEGEVVTPVARSSSGNWTIRHPIGDPGVYYVDVSIDSRSSGGAYCPDPYASSAFERREIIVEALAPG